MLSAQNYKSLFSFCLFSLKTKWRSEWRTHLPAGVSFVLDNWSERPLMYTTSYPLVSLMKDLMIFVIKCLRVSLQLQALLYPMWLFLLKLTVHISNCLPFCHNKVTFLIKINCKNMNNYPEVWHNVHNQQICHQLKYRCLVSVCIYQEHNSTSGKQWNVRHNVKRKQRKIKANITVLYINHREIDS